MKRFFEDIERYTDLFEKRNEPFWLKNDTFYKYYQKMLVPEGAIKKNNPISKSEGKKILKESKAILLRKSLGFTSKDTGWYAVICDNFIDIDSLKSKQKNEINKGLKNCIVKKISAKELSESGYECYIRAFENYKSVNVNIIKQDEFKRNVLMEEGFDDLIHYWGVYHDNKLIAYAINYIYGNTEVAYNSIKLHPDFLKHYPMYALIYKMNEYYLKEQNFEYVNDGFKTLLHDTGIQDFLIKKFGFKKQFVLLEIQYSFLLKIFIKMFYPFKKILSNIDKRFNALFELEKINRMSNL